MKQKHRPPTGEDVGKFIEQHGPTGALAQIMWTQCLLWAIADKDTTTAFNLATGCRYLPPRSPIEAAVDEATGVVNSFIIAFIPWFNENVWGVANGRACNGDEPIPEEKE